MSDSNKAKLRVKYGRFLAKAGRLDSALFQFKEAANEGEVVALFEAAGLVNQLGRQHEALELYNLYLGKASDPDGYVNKAGILLSLRRFDEAAAACEVALELSRNTSEAAAMNLFSALRATGASERAIQRAWEILNLPAVTVQPPTECAAYNCVKVVCVKWGVKYSWDYVAKLYRGVKRHWTCDRLSMQFICYCDQAPSNESERQEGAEYKAVADLASSRFFWGKSHIFSEDAGLDHSLVLYLDLDTIVVGDPSLIVSDYLSQSPRPAFSVLPAQGMYNERGIRNSLAMNTSVIVFTGGTHLRSLAAAATHRVRKFVHRFDHWSEMLGINSCSYISNQHFVDFRSWQDTDVPLPQSVKLILFPGDLKPSELPHTDPVRAQWV